MEQLHKKWNSESFRTTLKMKVVEIDDLVKHRRPQASVYLQSPANMSFTSAAIMEILKKTKTFRKFDFEIEGHYRWLTFD